MKCYACKHETEEHLWIIKNVQGFVSSLYIWFCPKCGTARISEEYLKSSTKHIK
jgi:hypothetical protein